MRAHGSPPAYAQAVLRIIDVRTGEPVEAAPARRGLTRVQAHASGLDATALRVLLTSDLLVRALELGGTPVWSLLTGDRQQAELRAAAGALGIRPFEDGTELGAGLGEAQVLHVMAGGAGDGRGVPVPEAAGEPRFPRRRGTPVSETAGGTPVSEATGRAVVAVAPVDSPTAAAPDLSEPGALRLALLSHPGTCRYGSTGRRWTRRGGRSRTGVARSPTGHGGPRGRCPTTCGWSCGPPGRTT